MADEDFRLEGEKEGMMYVDGRGDVTILILLTFVDFRKAIGVKHFTLVTNEIKIKTDQFIIGML